MIEVRREDLVTADAECVLRSVSSTLEPLTAPQRFENTFSYPHVRGPQVATGIGAFEEMFVDFRNIVRDTADTAPTAPTEEVQTPSSG